MARSGFSEAPRFEGPLFERGALLRRSHLRGLGGSPVGMLLAGVLCAFPPGPLWAQQTASSELATGTEGAQARAAEVQRLVNAAMDQEDEDEKEASLLRAHAIASEWADAAPESADAHYWLAATLGLRADIAGPRSKIRLGREAFEVAERGVALDSLHAGALHVLGRVHAGARGLNWLTRLIVGQLGLGEVLDASSWESAEALMVRAVELDPDNTVFRYELGTFYYGRKDWEPAREHLSIVLGSPGFVELPTSAQRRACDMLRELESEESCPAG